MGFMGPALIAVYAITLGARAIAGEQEGGGLEVTLSAPVTRGRLLTERAIAMLIDVTAVAVAAGLSLWLFSLLFGMHVGIGQIAAAMAALGIFGLFSGSVALTVGAATGSNALAKGIAALVVVASYLVNALSQVTSALKPTRPASPYYLLLGNEPLAHGLRVGGALAVLAVCIALVAAGGVVFARRDVT
jgi:ABC-2 type transport system permease protein